VVAVIATCFAVMMAAISVEAGAACGGRSCPLRLIGYAHERSCYSAPTEAGIHRTNACLTRARAAWRRRLVGHLDIHCRVITKAMVAKAEAERSAIVMARRAKARLVRALRASAGIPRTPPVLDKVAHKAAKAEWRRKARWRKTSATKRSLRRDQEGII
jgi:hypothetical protein